MTLEPRERIIGILEPEKCLRCNRRFVTSGILNGVQGKKIQCKRRDCDNWMLGDGKKRDASASARQELFEKVHVFCGDWTSLPRIAEAFMLDITTIIDIIIDYNYHFEITIDIKGSRYYRAKRRQTDMTNR